MAILQDPGHLISLREDVALPPRFLDLSPCDFFLWGYHKAEVFKRRFRTLKELKEIIREKLPEILKICW